jgi:hypothetical protein
MKIYRLIDIVIQVILISSGIAYGLISIYNPRYSFIYFYFIVGVWQIGSLVTHYFFATSTTFLSHRTFYTKLILATLILGIFFGILFSIFPSSVFFLLLYFFGLLWLSPLLAFYYLYICWQEYRLITKRELIHLK